MRHEALSPKKLTGCKYLGTDKKGNYIFNTNEGKWSAEPHLIVGLSANDLFATGIINRFVAKSGYKYQWVDDDAVEPVATTKPNKPYRHITNSVIGKLLQKGKVSK